MYSPEYAKGFSQGFNEGMQKAAEQYPKIIFLLAFSFLVKIVLTHPRVEKVVGERAAEALVFGSDVLAFVLTLILVYSYMGLPLA
jgi:hypothetical protein